MPRVKAGVVITISDTAANIKAKSTETSQTRAADPEADGCRDVQSSIAWILFMAASRYHNRFPFSIGISF
ncbi:hypothetical protein CQ12_16735 [Bradyrhizobium jicamae]|uniref:Uncharacterized protein n=1 Tax=Bradyrhizobium jicamae TaxID=280332 RepID=A0A0R3LF43_9BRAD|nr:hypothetical protein CQ12_16735 [Bradyrhizobium jicamae]